MAKDGEVSISKAGRNKVKDLAVPLCFEAAKKIADASNAQSSWGFYGAFPNAHSAVVAGLVHEADKDNARAQRILRNLDEGKF